jgi:hypothetical protein
MYTVWHVDKHKITFKLTNDKFQKSLSRPSIFDARAHYWASARRLRRIALRHWQPFEKKGFKLLQVFPFLFHYTFIAFHSVLPLWLQQSCESKREFPNSCVEVIVCLILTYTNTFRPKYSDIFFFTFNTKRRYHISMHREPFLKVPLDFASLS